MSSAPRPTPEAAAPRADAGAPKSVHLHPGRILVTAEPVAITTILGSCVAVCLWDRRAGGGGMSHHLLPDGPRNGAASHRYGNVAIEELVRRIVAIGGDRREMVAKIFGGAAVLRAFATQSPHLGQKNVDAALHALEHQGIPVVAQDTGGTRGRKLRFSTGDGHVWVKEL